LREAAVVKEEEGEKKLEIVFRLSPKVVVDLPSELRNKLWERGAVWKLDGLLEATSCISDLMLCCFRYVVKTLSELNFHLQQTCTAIQINRRSTHYQSRPPQHSTRFPSSSKPTTLQPPLTSPISIHSKIFSIIKNHCSSAKGILDFPIIKDHRSVSNYFQFS
jgi:hypothetical protein